MAAPWQPTFPVDAARARALVAIAFPDLAHHAPVHVGTGWDMVVWRFGDLAVRFPQRELGARCLERELLVLPRVADRLPAPVPRPLRIGAAAAGYPSRFYAHRWLPGAPAITAGLDDAALAALAAPLGALLRALHAVDGAGLPVDDRGDVAVVAARGRAWLDDAALAGLDPALRARAAAALDPAALPEPGFAPALVHGDAHAGNLLVDDRGRLAAVLDWGDAALADPAIDLAVAFSLIPPPARAALRAAYGPVDPPTWARARVHAISRQALALLAWARALPDPAPAAHAEAALRRALAA